MSPGGGVVINLFLKRLNIIVLEMRTVAMIKKNMITMLVIFVDVFIYYFFPYSAQEPSYIVGLYLAFIKE